QTTEEMNTDLDLSSSVEVNFRGEPVSLERLATSSQVSAIRANARNPDAEFQAAEQARAAREQRQATPDAGPRGAPNTELVPPPVRPPAAAQATSAAAGGPAPRRRPAATTETVGPGRRGAANAAASGPATGRCGRRNGHG